MIEKIILYEIRRAIARKKVITLIIITFLFEIGTYVLLDYAKSTHTAARFLSSIHEYVWLIGVLLPQSFLIHFIAISISAGSMAEEYEHGTMDFLLTKPITRLSFISGKFIGGYVLLTLMYGLMVIISLFLSFFYFGTQVYLNFLPELFGAVVFSALTFYSIAFLVGEIIRRGNIAFLVASVILVTSVALVDVLILLSTLTRNLSYLSISMYFPTWGAEEFPYSIAINIPGAYFLVEGLSLFGGTPGSPLLSSLSIIAYSVVPIFISIYTFLHRDIPKRVF
ncbi:MAG: ABC transporter permease [Sulfolobaceae archaeon]|nr:ABC transporter permease [Sulfolobaceae archaeon]